MNDMSIDTVKAALSGERKALASLVEALENPIYSLAYRMMLNREDARDATQEALIRIITRMSTFKGDAKFSTWAWRVAVNRILDYKSAAHHPAKVPAEVYINDLYQDLDMAAVETAEDALVVSQIKIGCAAALLNTLDGQHRAALILVDVMQFTLREAAQILANKEVTVRKQVSRARQKVRAALDHCGIVNPQAPCRCYRRITGAQKHQRIPALNIASPIAIDKASQLVQKVDRLAQVAAFYRLEPSLQAGLKDELMALVDVGKQSLQQAPDKAKL